MTCNNSKSSLSPLAPLVDHHHMSIQKDAGCDLAAKDDEPPIENDIRRFVGKNTTPDSRLVSSELELHGDAACSTKCDDISGTSENRTDKQAAISTGESLDNNITENATDENNGNTTEMSVTERKLSLSTGIMVSIIACIFAVLFLHITDAMPPGSGSGDNPSPSEILVKTNYGTVRGLEMRSRFNKTYYSYRGIPFAKPPLAELRFKPPQKMDPWVGILDGTKDGAICLQKNYLFSQNPIVEGSEDCLFLNVYTRRFVSPTGECTDPLPVMVFIHYGGNFVGSSSSDLLGPDFIMDKNMILVTFNYRLAVFGYLSTLDDNAPGNNGYKDQVAALKWVQENIEYFGGNKDNVTLAGQSAGAAAVHHHMLSPMSKGLFHKAISMSGTALALWARPFNAIQSQVYKTQAEIVGCDPKTDTKTIVECLQKVDAEKLLTSVDIFKYFSIEPLVIYTAVTEKKTPGNPEPFLEEEPLKIIERGEFSKVPWIIGLTTDEGMLRTAPIIRQKKSREQLNAGFDQLGPQITLLSSSVPESQKNETWNAMIGFYIGTHNIDIKNATHIQGFTNLYTDRSFAYSTYQTALLHSFKGHRPIWIYNFGYRGGNSYGDVFASTNETVDFKWGTSHCDDLLYIFSSPQILPNLPSADLTMSRIMIKFFSNFVKYGSPTPNFYNRPNHQGWDPIPDFTNKAMLNSNYHFLNITGPHDSIADANPVSLKMSAGYNPDRMHFLESLNLFENIPGIN